MSDAQQDLNDVVLEVPAAESVVSFDVASVLVKEPLAIQHLWAARHFATLAAAREDLLIAKDLKRPDLAHRSYVMSAVTSAASFMEAIVNDVFIDAADSGTSGASALLAPFDPVQIAELASIWAATEVTRTDPYLQLMTKYHRVIEIGCNAPFDKSDRVFQNADDLVFLRNYLVHFKTEWHKSDVKRNEAAKVEQRLRPRFDGNAQELSPWFPNRCLGAGCARWAHESATVFVGQWLERVGIQRDIVAEVADLEKSWADLEAELRT